MRKASTLSELIYVIVITVILAFVATKQFSEYKRDQAIIQHIERDKIENIKIK